MDGELRECLYCGALYEPIRPWQKFCQRSHRQAHYQAQQRSRRDRARELAKLILDEPEEE